MVVVFTVRFALPLEEVACAQLLVTVRAGEVLGVPRLAQRRYHLKGVRAWQGERRRRGYSFTHARGRREGGSENKCERTEIKIFDINGYVNTG